MNPEGRKILKRSIFHRQLPGKDKELSGVIRKRTQRVEERAAIQLLQSYATSSANHIAKKDI